MSELSGSAPFRTVLALAPHTDDGEIGCGATLARFCREGLAEVHLIAFSAAEKSVPAGMPSDINREDALTAAAHIGVPAANVDVWTYPVREFSAHRQAILDDMIRLRDSINPDLVFGPSSTDRHQDHEVIHNEMLRAFGGQTVLGQEFPWNCISFQATAHFEVSEDDIEAKAKALAAYRSQAGRPYMKADFVRSWAVTRGAQIKAPLAEAFEVLHWRVRQ